MRTSSGPSKFTYSGKMIDISSVESIHLSIGLANILPG